MRRTVSVLALLLIVFPWPTPHAEGIKSKLKACGTATVKRVESGDRLRLASGQTLQLAEIKAPELWPEESGYNSWPHAWQAKKALERLVGGQDVSLYCDRREPSQDITGSIVAQIRRTHDNLWIQENLVRNGHAYVFPHGYTKATEHARLREAELEARTAKRGLWARSAMQVQAATGDSLRPGWFQIVEGTVVSSAKRQDKAYLNFGQDWRTDFTVEIPRRLYRRFGAIMADQHPFQGTNIEVRGWMEWAGGPKIILESAEQLVLLPKDPAD